MSVNNCNGPMDKFKNLFDKSDSIEKKLTKLRESFKTGKTLDVNFRIKQLKQLLRLYEENNDEILAALKKDMRKSKLEGYLYEVDVMKNDVRGAIRNLKLWDKEKFIKRNWLALTDRGCIKPSPYGVVLIIGPWNYPFQLTLVPMCGAIAGGNCVIIKPSEISYHSAQCMLKLIPNYLDTDCYQVVIGGPMETENLLKHQFDYIFYTGSINVGRKIHLAANKYLTPVTLELGGKSPVYIDDTVNYAMTARRIMWGKCMNMGQTCVAPDYVLCSKSVEDEIIKECWNAMYEWYGKDWKKEIDLARIINLKHFQRLTTYIKNYTEDDGYNGKIVMGGKYDQDDLWIEPCIIVNVKETDPIMLEEIFGPILVFIRVDSPEEAITLMNARPRPLCLYVFTENEDISRHMINMVRSGTVAVNDTIVQFVVDELPFGGFGESGMGNYHGHYSFKTFTHEKSIAYRDFSYIGDKVGSFRYPPYTMMKINFLSFLLCHWKKFKIEFMDYFPHFICFIIGIILTVIVMNGVEYNV